MASPFPTDDDEDIGNALNIARADAGAQAIQNKIGGLNQFLTGMDLEANVPQFHTGLPQQPQPQIGGAGLPSQKNISNEIFSNAQQMPKEDFINKYAVEVRNPGKETHEEMMAMAEKQNKMPPHYNFPIKNIDPSEMESWTEKMYPNFEKHSDEISNYIKQGNTIPPILVEGSPFDKKYRPMVLDGHHRVVASLKAGKNSIDGWFTNKTLGEIWDNINNLSLVKNALSIANKYGQ